MTADVAFFSSRKSAFKKHCEFAGEKCWSQLLTASHRKLHGVCSVRLCCFGVDSKPPFRFVWVVRSGWLRKTRLMTVAINRENIVETFTKGFQHSCCAAVFANTTRLPAGPPALKPPLSHYCGQQSFFDEAFFFMCPCGEGRVWKFKANCLKTTKHYFKRLWRWSGEVLSFFCHYVSRIKESSLTRSFYSQFNHQME